MFVKRIKSGQNFRTDRRTDEAMPIYIPIREIMKISIVLKGKWKVLDTKTQFHCYAIFMFVQFENKL